MIILRDPSQVTAIADDAIRRLLSRRFTELSQDGPYNADAFGYFVIVQPGDTLMEVDEQTGLPILQDLFDDGHFGESEIYQPCCEWLERHDTFYEAVWVLNDDAFAVTLIVPRVLGILPDLVRMCEDFATPAQEAAD